MSSNVIRETVLLNAYASIDLVENSPRFEFYGKGSYAGVGPVVMSRGDRTYEELPFYISVGTRELLVVARSVNSLVLFRNDQHEMVEVAASTTASPAEVQSEILP